MVKNGGGNVKGEFTPDGERWRTKLYYQESGLQHPGACLPSGTEFQLQTVREFRIALPRQPEEDPVGQQTANIHLSPRWQWMKSKGSGPDPSVPEDVDEAVNIRVSGSNIEFDRYLDHLQAAARSVGIHGYYFQQVHPFSNVQDAARYVRLLKSATGPIHARRFVFLGWSS